MKSLISYLSQTVNSGETTFSYGFIYTVVLLVITMVLTIILYNRKERKMSL